MQGLDILFDIYTLIVLLISLKISGFSRCDFVGKDGISRTKWVIPDALKKVAYLKDWKYPAGHSKIACIFPPAKASVLFD